jgi:hypothetical protein
MSMIGKWDGWYKGIGEAPTAFRYGDTITYQLGAAFLIDCPEVEDWGCGPGGFRRFYRGKYTGVDGSKTSSVDKIADLRSYESHVDGIFMRHVLEHNYDWELILQNAVKSFRRKFCLVLFTPFAETTCEVRHNRSIGVDAPDLSFSKMDIRRNLGTANHELWESIPTDTGNGIEHIYFVWR